jgi:hypothetical protein
MIKSGPQDNDFTARGYESLEEDAQQLAGGAVEDLRPRAGAVKDARGP